jgi:hypothetical protein|tara:strand:+ start:473 stop:904 length:432 start_codon:yes stop_codon:yes gene_type:complete
MSRESDEYYEYRDDLYSRLYIDAHLCRPECGDLGVIDSETKKGIIYLAAFRGPWIAGVFLQSKGYEIITDETCNQCGDRVKLVRNLSRLEIRRCNDCNENFNIETVSWSTHSFTVVDNEFVRDRYYYKCPTHYGPQDRDMMFL